MQHCDRSERCCITVDWAKVVDTPLPYRQGCAYLKTDFAPTFLQEKHIGGKIQDEKRKHIVGKRRNVLWQTSEFPGANHRNFRRLGPLLFKPFFAQCVRNSQIRQVRDVHIQNDCLADGFVRLFGQVRDVSRKRMESAFSHLRAIKSAFLASHSGECQSVLLQLAKRSREKPRRNPEFFQSQATSSI
jgi:hypothetical protein